MAPLSKGAGFLLAKRLRDSKNGSDISKPFCNYIYALATISPYCSFDFLINSSTCFADGIASEQL